MKQTSGFTLIELLVTLTIVSILVMFAVPNFTETAGRNRLAAGANEILNSLQFARTEALRRSGNVSLGPIDGADWGNGIVVYVDAAGGADGVYDDGEEIRFFDNFAGNGTTLVAEGASTNVLFDARGFATSNGAGAPPAEETLQLCDDRPAEIGRNINLLVSGSVFFADADDCN